MKIKLWIVVLLGIAVLPVGASAADIFIAQSAAGTGDGSSCVNAKAVSFFNTASNWGTGTGKIGPGVTAHLCGTITTDLTFQGNGTSGSPVVLDGTGATVSAHITVGTAYWTIQNVTWSTSFPTDASTPLTVYGGTFGTINGNTLDVNVAGIVIFIGQSGTPTLGHDIVISNNFIRNSTNNSNDQEDLLDSEGSYNVTVEGNYFEMRASDDAGSDHDDCLQVWQKGGASAGPPYNWTIRYNEFVMNSTAANNRSWHMLEQIGTGYWNVYGNLYVGLKGGSSGNGIVFDSNTSGMVANVYGNTIVEKAGANNNLFNLSGSGTINLSNNITYSSDAGNALTGGGTTHFNRSNNLWYGSDIPSCVATEICGKDPLFTNYTGNDFSLTSPSPARSLGVNLGASYSAYAMAAATWPNPTLGTRPASGNWDAGYTQYGGSAPPPTAPTISLAPTSLSFTTSMGTNPTSKTFVVNNTVSGTSLPWSVSSSTSWLTVAPTSGTISGVSGSTVTVSVNVSGLATGSHTGTLTVTGTGATNTPQTVSVSLSLSSTSVTISVSPTTASLGQNGTKTFTATVTGTTNTSVTWTRTPALGTVSTSGIYTAPAVISASQTVTVKATSVADTTKSATAVVTLVPPVAVVLNPESIQLGPSQTQQFSATVSGSTNTAVTWKLNPTIGEGTLSGSGLYTAPATITTAHTVTVTATSVADPTKSDVSTITLSSSTDQPPQVSMTSPTNNSVYTAPGTIVLKATASDPDGTVAQVAFYNGSTLLTTVMSSPYAYTWNSVSSGTYVLTAKATDNQGAVTTSGKVTVVVNASAEQAPTAVITGGPFSGTPPLVVPVDGSQSTAPGGTIVSYHWDFGDGTTASGVTASHTYNTAGVFAMTLLVTNDQGQVDIGSQIVNTQGSATLPTPNLSNLNGGAFPVNGTLSINYSSPVTGFKWSLIPMSSGGSSRYASTVLGQASVTGYATIAPELGLSTFGLSVGAYTLTVQAVNGSQTSAPGTATISLTFGDLGNVRVYPNPWRKDKHAGHPIMFDQMPGGSDVKIFTISGHKIKDLDGTSGKVTWDLTTDSGDRVASGIYIYLIKDNTGNKLKGKIAVIQ